MAYSQKNKNQSEKTILEVIIVGIFKGLWWLITLPFKKGGGKKGLTNEDREHIISKRTEIESLAKSNSPYDLRHGLMEADKLVDFILKAKGYQGQTFADRLCQAEAYTDRAIYQAVWDGHKVRNKIAHDDCHISDDEIKNAIKKLLRYVYE